MKVLTLIEAKSNVFLWYVQCCSCTRRSKTKILTTRAPPSWIEFDVVTSHCQTRHLEYGLWILLISMFLRLLISCKSQKNRLRVSSNRLHSRKHFEFDIVMSQRQTQSLVINILVFDLRMQLQHCRRVPRHVRAIARPSVISLLLHLN